MPPMQGTRHWLEARQPCPAEATSCAYRPNVIYDLCSSAYFLSHDGIRFSCIKSNPQLFHGRLQPGEIVDHGIGRAGRIKLVKVRLQIEFTQNLPQIVTRCKILHKHLRVVRACIALNNPLSSMNQQYTASNTVKEWHTSSIDTTCTPTSSDIHCVRMSVICPTSRSVVARRPVSEPVEAHFVQLLNSGQLDRKSGVLSHSHTLILSSCDRAVLVGPKASS